MSDGWGSVEGGLMSDGWGSVNDGWGSVEGGLRIYAKENSQGMFFDPNEYDNYQPEDDAIVSSQKSPTATPKAKRDNKAGLKVLK